MPFNRTAPEHNRMPLPPASSHHIEKKSCFGAHGRSAAHRTIRGRAARWGDPSRRASSVCSRLASRTGCRASYPWAPAAAPRNACLPRCASPGRQTGRARCGVGSGRGRGEGSWRGGRHSLTCTPPSTSMAAPGGPGAAAPTTAAISARLTPSSSGAEGGPSADTCSSVSVFGRR